MVLSLWCGILLVIYGFLLDLPAWLSVISMFSGFILFFIADDIWYNHKRRIRKLEEKIEELEATVLEMWRNNENT